MICDPCRESEHDACINWGEIDLFTQDRVEERKSCYCQHKEKKHNGPQADDSAGETGEGVGEVIGSDGLHPDGDSDGRGLEREVPAG